VRQAFGEYVSYVAFRVYILDFDFPSIDPFAYRMGFDADGLGFRVCAFVFSDGDGRLAVAVKFQRGLKRKSDLLVELPQPERLFSTAE